MEAYLLLAERKVCLYFLKIKQNQFPQSNLFQFIYIE